MLIVRRRTGEAILIGDGIEVAVMEISPTRVKLGITASRAVTVTRRECMGIAADNRKAAELVRAGAELSAIGAVILRALGNKPGDSAQESREMTDKN